MTWVKLDDGFYEHPKIDRAGGDAGWLYVCAIAYSSRNQTDGFVTAGKVGRLTDRSSPGELAERLVATGLWHGPGESCVSDVCPAHYRVAPDDGYVIHDYWGYQPTRAEASTRQGDLRAKRSEAGKLGAHTRWHGDSPRHDCEHCIPMATAMASAIANGVASDSPDPTRPDPTRFLSSRNRQTDVLDIGDLPSVSRSVEFDSTVSILVAHAEATTPNRIVKPVRWREFAEAGIVAEKGEAIDRLVAEGHSPQSAAEAITGDGLGIRNAMRAIGLTVEAPAGWGAAS